MFPGAELPERFIRSRSRSSPPEPEVTKKFPGPAYRVSIPERPHITFYFSFTVAGGKLFL